MNIDYPLQSQLGELRALWQASFGDENAFLDAFYTHGFAPDRCRCVTENGKIVAALYWFDCSVNGQPIAYLYAIATAKASRGKGLCRALMENTHSHLKYLGYAGAILVPAEEKLFRMYEKMGYTTCSDITELFCTAAEEKISLRKLSGEEYIALRREYLPQNGVLQEGTCIEFLRTMADFYDGEDFLLDVAKEENYAPELLGNFEHAAGIVSALGRKNCRFCIPGTEKPFAMYHPLSDVTAPEYFGLAFD